MPATYGISTLGQVMVIDEGEEYRQTTPLRAAYLLADFLMYLIPTITIGLKYLQQRSTILKQRQKSTSAPLWLLTSVFVLFIVNNAIRSLHMIDHNYRPVYYHEPLWAYQKYIIVEMEVATYANVLISITGYFAIKNLLQALHDNKISEWRSQILFYSFFYFGGAFFNLVHYTIEPPSNYGAFANFTISGPTVTGVPSLALVLYALCFWKSSSVGGGGKKLAAKESKKLLVEDNDGGKSEGTKATKGRRRSKTPVKGARTK